MKSVFDKLNLRPQERRLLVFAFLVLFAVVNVWLIWPHFDDWRIAINRRDQARKKLLLYRTEIARVPAYQQKKDDLQKLGYTVASEENALQLTRTVQTLAAANQIFPTRYDPNPVWNTGVTNSFFEEQSLTIHLSAGNKELVNFLVNVAKGSSVIRVKSLDFKPDRTETKIEGWITFVASYQKQTPTLSTNKPTATAPRRKT